MQCGGSWDNKVFIPDFDDRGFLKEEGKVELVKIIITRFRRKPLWSDERGVLSIWH